MDDIQHRFNAGAQRTAQERGAACAEAACRAAAGEGGDIRVQTGGDDAGQMAQSRVQAGHTGIVRALLRGKHTGRAVRTVQGVADVAHDGEGRGVQRRVKAAQVDGGQLGQRDTGGDEGAALTVIEHRAQGRGRAAAAVVGAAAAQTQDQPLCAMVQRVGQELAHAVGGGALRVKAALRLGQARRRGALYHRRAVGQQAIAGGEGIAEGVGDGCGELLTAAGVQKAVRRALAAVGYRQGVDMPAGEGDAAGDAADVRGGQSAFERVGDNETAFHGARSFHRDKGIIPAEKEKDKGRLTPDIPTFVWDFSFQPSFRPSDSFQLFCGISVFTPDFG